MHLLQAHCLAAIQWPCPMVCHSGLSRCVPPADGCCVQGGPPRAPGTQQCHTTFGVWRPPEVALTQCRGDPSCPRPCQSHVSHGGRGGGGAHAHGNTETQAMDDLRTEVCGQQKQSNDPCNNQHNPQYANDWAPLTRKRHIPPHPAQPQHTNDGALRTRKRHQREQLPQRPTERSDPTQHAKGRTGDRPRPRKEATTRRNVTRGGTQAFPPRARAP